MFAECKLSYVGRQYLAMIVHGRVMDLVRVNDFNLYVIY